MAINESDQRDKNIIILISKMYVNFLDLINLYELPDQHLALVNFTGREMKLLENGTKSINWAKLKRKISFTIDDLSRFAINTILLSLLIGREINKIRLAANLQPIDWYARAIEEDKNGTQKIH